MRFRLRFESLEGRENPSAFTPDVPLPEPGPTPLPGPVNPSDPGPMDPGPHDPLPDPQIPPKGPGTPPPV